jgi:hypothetical protein
MTLTMVRKALSKIGVKVSYIEDTEEFRVTFPNDSEKIAYYASDLEDALYTGYAMKGLKYNA